MLHVSCSLQTIILPQNQRIRRVDIAARIVATIAGTVGTSGYADGLGTSVRFNGPQAIAVDESGSVALVVSRVIYVEGCADSL